MKKLISFFLVAILLLTMFPSECYAAEIKAKPSIITVNINGESKQVVSYVIKNNGYIKIRDIAYCASGSYRQFNVIENIKKNIVEIKTNQVYKIVGNEVSTKYSSKSKVKAYKGKIILDGKAIKSSVYYIDNDLYVNPCEIGKLLNFTVDYEKKDKQYFINTNHSWKTKKIGIETAMTYGTMKLSDKNQAWVGYDFTGKVVSGWHQIGPKDVRLFVDFGLGPVLICFKVVVSNGRFYFLEDKLVYEKEINGIKIPLEEDGGISARKLENVLGDYYETFLKESGNFKINHGMPAKQSKDINISYKITCKQKVVNLNELEKKDIVPYLTPKVSVAKKFLFTSSNNKVACIDEDGTVYGIGPGNCILTISLDGRNDVKPAKLKVTVKGKKITNKVSTGFVCFDYYDDDVANVFQAPTIKSMRQDGANWVSYINTLSYTSENPIHIGGVSDINTITMREIRKDEFEQYVKSGKANGMKVAAQTQIMYDELLKNWLSDEAKRDEKLFYEESQKFWAYFGGLLNDNAKKWTQDPGNTEMNAFWDQWFLEYEKNILEYATWCQKYNVDLLIIGEYQGNAFYRIGGGRMEKLIQNIRKVYTGKIAAVCNYSKEWNEFSNLTFADQLDYINVVLQEPYSEKASPTLEEYQNELNTIIKDYVVPLYKKYNKKIILTSSYKSAESQGNKPWFEAGTSQPNIKQDFIIQSKMYEALFREVANKPWLESIWANGYTWIDNFEAPDGRLNSFDKGQSVRNKPASKIFLKWSLNK